MFLDVLERSDTAKAVSQTAQALRDVFTKDRLEELLLTRLNRRLQDLSTADNFRRTAFQVVATAADEGWLADLLRASKEEIPLNRKFQTDCDRILGLLQTKEETEKAKAGEPVPHRRIVSLILCGLILVALCAWGIILFGLTAVWSVCISAAVWLATNVLQYFFESEKVRRVDQLLRSILDRRPTPWILGGLLSGGLIASLFVGAVQAPAEYQKHPAVSVATMENDVIGRPLDFGRLRRYGTIPWRGRVVTVFSDGYEPLPVTLWPWWRRRLNANMFELAPYVLVTVRNRLADGFSRDNPGRLEIEVDGDKRHLSEYLGELVLLGDTMHQPKWVIIPAKADKENSPDSHSYKRTAQLHGGIPRVLDPPVLLRPGTNVTLRPLKSVELEDGTFTLEAEANAEFTFKVHKPAGPEEALKEIMLGKPD